MPSKNLERGQFQIGDLVMGTYTMFKVEKVDIGNYDINDQAFQKSMSNELSFGQDSLKPAPIQMTINLLVNKQLSAGSLVGDSRILNFDNDPNLGALQKEWRAEEIMQEWGAIKPLYFCGTDGITRMFFGRPGKFTYQKHKIIDSQFYQITAEFRRSDTFAYGEQEYYEAFPDPDTPRTVSLTRGNAPSWIRFLLLGPIDVPTINFGEREIILHYNIPAGVAVEINAYPWSGRRVVASNGLSLAAYLEMTPDPYLDKLRWTNNTETLVSWTGTGLTADSGMSLLWYDAYQVMD